jgi:hypothetical protein
MQDDNDEDVDSGPLVQVPDYRNYLVYCDEASIDSQRYYGWGTVWIPAEARGRLSALFQDLRRQHFLSGDEVKWTKVRDRTRPYFEALLDAFFRKGWILFHCLIVDTQIVNTGWFDDGMTEARIRHLSAFLRTKIGFLSATEARKKYHVRVDLLPSPYRKEDEKLFKIANAMLRQKVGDKRIASLDTVNSKRSRGVQLADFLLGAVLAPWNGRVESGSAKARISSLLYENLGWPDHLADTNAQELKFNIWHFHDSSKGPRAVRARPVQLKHPFKSYRV